MKKHFIVTACLLFFCGGLLVLHLAAQSTKTPSPAEEKIFLLDPKMEQCSERELLELKVSSYKKLLDLRDRQNQAGMPEGRLTARSDAHANLANAEVELYRHIGDTVKLQSALKTKVEAYRKKLDSVNNAYEGGSTSRDSVWTAEIQLLDALLEQKRTLDEGK